MMKKIAIVLSLAMLMTLLTVTGSALAGGELRNGSSASVAATVSVSRGIAAPGDYVTLTVSVSGSAPARSLAIRAIFDDNLLELSDGAWLMSNATIIDWNTELGDGVILFDTPQNINGEVLSLTFRVLNGEYNTTVYVDCEVTIMADTVLPAKTVSGGIDIGCDHERTILTAVAPTCTETGLTEGSYCSICDIMVVPQETVDCLPHTPEAVPAVPPTCVETGLAEGERCAICHEILVGWQEIETQNHIPGEWEVVLPPAVGVEGQERIMCVVCGRILGRRPIDMLYPTETAPEQSVTYPETSPEAEPESVPGTVSEAPETDPPRPVETKAPVKEPASSGGCFGTLSTSGTLIVLMTLAGARMLRKKGNSAFDR